MAVTEVVGVETIKKARPELREYKFLPTTDNQICIPVCNKDNRFDVIDIDLDIKLKDNSDIIKFGVDDEHRIVAYKII